MKKLLLLLAIIGYLEARTQDFGYLVVKDSTHRICALKTASIDTVQALCPEVNVDFSVSNYFEYDNGVVHYYVERKYVVVKNGKLKLKRIR